MLLIDHAYLLLLFSILLVNVDQKVFFRRLSYRSLGDVLIYISVAIGRLDRMLNMARVLNLLELIAQTFKLKLSKKI